MREVVWARRFGIGMPDVNAFDQYIPDAGAGGTSGESSVRNNGGNAVYCPFGGREVLVKALGIPLPKEEWPEAIALVDRIACGFFP